MCVVDCLWCVRLIYNEDNALWTLQDQGVTGTPYKILTLELFGMCVCVGGGGGGREWGAVVTNGSEHCQLSMPALSVTSRRYDYFN